MRRLFWGFLLVLLGLVSGKEVLGSPSWEFRVGATVGLQSANQGPSRPPGGGQRGCHRGPAWRTRGLVKYLDSPPVSAAVG